MNRKAEKRKVAKNLHRQFAHATPVKLTELMKNADINNKELCVIIKEIAKEYEVCSKYQTACVIHSKRKEVIVQIISKIWIAVFGSPKTFLVDNGDEFYNRKFISFNENSNINIFIIQSFNICLRINIEEPKMDFST